MGKVLNMSNPSRSYTGEPAQSEIFHDAIKMFELPNLSKCLFNPPIASVFFLTYVASGGGGKLPPTVFQVLCQQRRDSSDFRSHFFPSYPHQPCRTPHALVNSIWRTQTGSSYKLVTTQFSGMSHPLPPVLTSSDFGEQHQVQFFSLCICQSHPTLPSPRNSKMANGYRK